jgi:pentatricopeptide repeat protein
VTNGRQTAAVSVDAINSAIAAAGRCGRPDIAVKTLNEMNFKYSLKPNERTYRSAIVACNQAEHEKRRNRTRTVESSEKDVDNDGRLKAGGGREVEVDEAKDDPLSFEWWEAALSLFRRMKEDQIQPSIQTYSSVISACEAAGQWQRAIGILRSMTETKDTICQPNLFCFNAALAACEKGNAWLEAVELYERMRATGGSIMPNFISMNSLLIALDKGEQRELAESIYKEALKEKILTPWKYTLDSNCDERVRAFDLHQFSIPMAKIAVRNVVDSLLQKRASHDVAKDLIMVLGKGKGSIDGKAKLMPVIKALLKDEYNINASVEENNPGRIRIQSEVLIEFIETRRWQ